MRAAAFLAPAGGDRQIPGVGIGKDGFGAMLGIYLCAAIIGGGLLLFSVLGGIEHGSDYDPSGVDAGVDFDHDIGHDLGHDVGHDAGSDVSHDADAGSGGGWAGELVLGLFRPRNVVFFLAGFGVTGTLVTLLTNSSTSAGLFSSVAMGLASMVVTHGTFVWLRRSESAVDTTSDTDMEGCVARVVLPLAPGERGRIACRMGEREVYVVARLAEGYTEMLLPGREVIVLDVTDTVARVMPFETQLPPPSTD